MKILMLISPKSSDNVGNWSIDMISSRNTVISSISVDLSTILVANSLDSTAADILYYANCRRYIHNLSSPSTDWLVQLSICLPRIDNQDQNLKPDILLDCTKELIMIDRLAGIDLQSEA